MPFESPDQPESQPRAHTPDAPKFRRFGRVPRAAMVVGLAVGLALGGAGIAFAATSSSSTPSTTAPPSTARPGHGFRGFGRPGGPRAFGGLGGIGGLGRVVHGEFTTRTPKGGYQTVEVQVGKVASVSSTSIAVTSADGYSHTYSVTSSSVVDSQRDGISSVAKGDQVVVTATAVSGKDTVTNIVDTTKVGASRNGFGFGPPNRPAAPKAPAASAAD